jgi:hypothetical protein
MLLVLNNLFEFLHLHLHNYLINIATGNGRSVDNYAILRSLEEVSMWCVREVCLPLLLFQLEEFPQVEHNNVL